MLFIKFFKRWIFLYILTGLILAVICRPKYAIFQRLNSLSYTATYPLNVYHKKFRGDPAAYRNTILYYRLVNLIIPSARAYEMTGFCYGGIPDQVLAVQNYQTALKIAPRFFWLKYNLGILYYKNSEYRKAVDYFRDIAGADLKDLVTASVFVNFSRRPPEEREKYYLELINFSRDVQNSSRLALAACEKHLKKETINPADFKPELILHPLAYIMVGQEEFWGR